MTVSNISGLFIFLTFLHRESCFEELRDYGQVPWIVQVEGGEVNSMLLAEKTGLTNYKKLFSDYYIWYPSSKHSISDSEIEVKFAGEKQIKWFSPQNRRKRSKRSVYFNDPGWEAQRWYLDSPMRITDAWEQGYTGRGVVVTVTDDSVDKNHEDLRQNYVRRGSRNLIEMTSNPSPKHGEKSHGTKCAGIVAASANNSRCGVGVAFNGYIGGIRFLDSKKETTDDIESEALYSEVRANVVDIYLNSWGVEDDGRTIDKPDRKVRKALLDGVTKGRNGKGHIYVWASGNGGAMDNCGADGYVTNIYSVAISGAAPDGTVPNYTETCSATMATAYSRHDGDTEEIVTTSAGNQCTGSFSGTSAAASIAAGIMALTLEANSLLTWRDMQHLTVLSAQPQHLCTEDWQINGAGLAVSHFFGFGLLSAVEMISLAQQWNSSEVGDQRECQSEQLPASEIHTDGRFTVAKYTSDGCHGNPLAKPINHLEHVQVMMTLHVDSRNGLEILLESPMGTVSKLMTPRPLDQEGGLWPNWTFMSVQFWGEDPKGEWKLRIRNKNETAAGGHLYQWRLILYGTSEHPQPSLKLDKSKPCKIEKDILRDPFEPDWRIWLFIGASSTIIIVILVCAIFYHQHRIKEKNSIGMGS